MSETTGHRRSRVVEGICAVAACCWALAGFLFGWEGFVTYYANTGGPPDSSFSLLALIAGASYMFGPLFLIVLGLVYLSRGGRFGSWWLTGWTAIMAACLMTTILTLLWADALWPVTWVASRLDLLAISAAHLLVGAAMVAAIFRASRWTPSAREPSLLSSLGLGFVILAMGEAAYVVTGHVGYILFMSWFLGAFYIGIVITTRLRNKERIAPRSI
jgi:hypothetical protein